MTVMLSGALASVQLGTMVPSRGERMMAQTSVGEARGGGFGMSFLGTLMMGCGV